VLDEIARIKRSDAILAHVSNPQISDRLMWRWGWERHLVQSSKRQFIKRFYGVYPESLLHSSDQLAWENPGQMATISRK
jgi:hypothetical protein